MIPKAIREMFNIHEKQTMVFRVENDEIIIRKEDGAEVLNRLLSRLPDKLPVPEDIDWDEEAYSELEEEMKLYKNHKLRDDLEIH